MQVIQVKCWSEQEFLLKFQSVRNMCFFGFQLDFVQIISPQFGQLVQLFPNVEIQGLKFSLRLKILDLEKNLKESIFLRRTSLTSNRAPMVPKTDILTKNTQNDKNH